MADLLLKPFTINTYITALLQNTGTALVLITGLRKWINRSSRQHHTNRSKLNCSSLHTRNFHKSKDIHSRTLKRIQQGNNIRNYMLNTRIKQVSESVLTMVNVVVVEKLTPATCDVARRVWQRSKQASLSIFRRTFLTLGACRETAGHVGYLDDGFNHVLNGGHIYLIPDSSNHSHGKRSSICSDLESVLAIRMIRICGS